MSDLQFSGAVLTIDLDAIRANWRRLRDRLGATGCAAVVKADAYGLGVERVAPALADVGCRVFFVAHLDEGIQLRKLLPGAEIHVLNGLLPGSAGEFAAHGLIPVLNSLGNIDEWREFGRKDGDAPRADLHIDTGMARLGLPPSEVQILRESPDRLEGVKLRYLMSHLACADEPDHKLNQQQLSGLRAAQAGLPALPVSFANSSGIFLGPDYHLDLARPGIALYGGNPAPGQPNPMEQVVRLQGKILQLRDVDTPQTVGYGASHRVAGRGRIATIAVGYADGYLRSLSNAGSGYLGDQRAPVVGRVSMDLITLDVTAIPRERCVPGAPVDLIGPHTPIDSVAAAAGTIGYEILTSLGSRYRRVYRGSAD